MDEIGPSERAAMDGAAPAEIIYREWLGMQSKHRQDDLGHRGAHYLTLTQLATRNGQCFERAGL